MVPDTSESVEHGRLHVLHRDWRMEGIQGPSEALGLSPIPDTKPSTFSTGGGNRIKRREFPAEWRISIFTCQNPQIDFARSKVCNPNALAAHITERSWGK